MRGIPATMATQHPDNACAPYWEKNGNGFVSVTEEIPECVICFQDLDVQEFMWDWEGKYADEAVVDKLYSQYFHYFKSHSLGKEKFLTFRLPNIWLEKGYSLLRALMVILTSEDFARDLHFHSPPLFEVILPMTERTHQLLYMQRSFQKLARFKSRVFEHNPFPNSDYLSMIPLFEGVETQIRVKTFLEEYHFLHKKYFRKSPPFLRPFIARSDPAMTSGLVATVLANKIAISEMYSFSGNFHVPVYPIIGVGSLPFRGGLTPTNPKDFMRQYPGIRTVTIQSAFRYDYPIKQVRKTIRYLNQNIPNTTYQEIPTEHQKILHQMIHRFARAYQRSLQNVLKDVAPLFLATPQRRERRLHTGLLAYQRTIKNQHLPRAISFTCGFYSLGVPPEFIGVGKVLEKLSDSQLTLLQKYYPNIILDLVRAGNYLNRNNLEMLCRTNPAWTVVKQDIDAIEKILNVKFSPKNKKHFEHMKLSTKIFLQKHKKEQLASLISQAGKLRRSLG